MIAIRSREPADARTLRSQPPILMLSNSAARVDAHGWVMSTSRAMRSNCHWMRPMSSRPMRPSFGMVPW